MRWMMSGPVPDKQQVVFVPRQDGEAQELTLADLPPCSPGAVRLIIVSDTHGRHRDISVPEGDVFLHCGDIFFSSVLAPEVRNIAMLRDFNAWLQSLPCKEKVVVCGNHDTFLERLGPNLTRETMSAAVVLHDSATLLPLSNLKVYGNAYSEGGSHNNAWQTDLRVSASCQDANVVVTHHYTPKLVDRVLAHARPLVWASGHNHRKHGVRTQGGMMCVNASIVNHNYQPCNPIVVVDLLRGSARA